MPLKLLPTLRGTFAPALLSASESRRPLGAELITNGDFASDTVWTKSATWTIAGGVAVATAAAIGDQISQPVSGPSSALYEITFTMTDAAAQNVAFVLVGATDVIGTSRTAAGTYTEQVIAPASFATFAIRAISGPLSTTIDNISIRQVVTL